MLRRRVLNSEDVPGTIECRLAGCGATVASDRDAAPETIEPSDGHAWPDGAEEAPLRGYVRFTTVSMR